jgi:hypothetical protein
LKTESFPLARKFLYFIAFSILLVFAAFLVLRLFPETVSRAVFVPSADFEVQAAAPPSAYAETRLWWAHPKISPSPANWQPAALEVATEVPDRPSAAVFFVHPTSYLNRAHWNAPLDDAEANARTRIFLRGLASAFYDAGPLWSPKYRQATLGAFLAEDRVTAGKAIDAAYQDVAMAFDQMVKENPADQPIILAGHSQGALHLTRLLKEKVAGQPLAKRIVAAYVVGWPVSVDTDLAAMGLPACAAPEQANCILSWASFAEPADPAMVLGAYDATVGFDGRPRRGTRMLCTNPLTGTVDAEAEAAANLGTIKPDAKFEQAELLTGMVPARCDDDRGLLLIGPPIDLGPYVLPGNNYHVYDIPLFWMNVRADVARRLATFAPG